MTLNNYDGKCVRIVDAWGDVVEGICTHNSAEYCECEFGRSEECLQIMYFLFYKSDIKEITSLENKNGKYGKFSDRYGKIEMMVVEDDIDMLTDALLESENEHVYRLLLCLDDYLDPKNNHKFKYHDEVMEALEKVIRYNTDEKIKSQAKLLIDKWK